ncbi:MAG: aromatic aminobenezylarsenical efflux permease ArsG family transporter [Alphaproteobacteria bacterium]|nr:aromatic aminobenezylarsenical efflux permease ArsG family transporter [Alphaproteobacteria bacterium]
MGEYTLALASAFWLGILTSISPCPLATNVAAMSFVGRRVGNPKMVFWAGSLYTGGRALTYGLLGAVLVSSLLSAPSLSHALQKYMNLALGPLLIFVGMVLLEMIAFNVGGSGIGGWLRKKLERTGFWGAGFMGIVFALSFCPTSAALFFGSLLPLALKQESGLTIPVTYGVATGLPVLLFAVLIAMGANKVAKAYDRIVSFERWARKGTGVIFIAAGIYYCLVLVFGISFSV